MKKNLSKRLLSLLLVFVLLIGHAVPAGAVASRSNSTNLSITERDSAPGLDRIGQVGEPTPEAPVYEDTDVIRVSIVLERKSTLQVGFSSQGIATNAVAQVYRKGLAQEQKIVLSRIEKALGAQLDVAWNLTLAANLISANVAYGDIDAIAAVPGVKEVVIENRYEPCVIDREETEDPEMITSTIMSGAVNVWANGYTGAGSRVAVIDTGIDEDHQSFSEKGLMYSLECNAEAAGMSTEDYLESLDLLDAEEIAAVASQLNIPQLNVDKAYHSAKIPFGYNYIDENYKITHDYDGQGEHGSHVEGIAAANSYIPQRDGSFAEALELVNVKGVAPDAQIISMKVFGANGGAYDSDYMAAIEDAIVLGADSVNLSLGSGSAGFSFNATYEELLAGLRDTDTVVTISTGNSNGWDEDTEEGRLYVEDIRFATNGSPGSYSNSLAVASVESTAFNADGTYTAPEYYTMSDFSSWGIPESLELKPEITAPGGNIYSVNGAIAGGKSYETMSGTSMAAPQMAGMAAVMAQYIRENGLCEKTGLTVRQLTQSLLMSTAMPLDQADTDYYYSVLQQGSGMAQLDAAVAADGYILMGDDATAYAADGKVKAELGDDPDRSGAYTFSFSIHNFGAEVNTYRLRTELFTQKTDGEYLYQDTVAMAANVVYTVDGVEYVPAAATLVCDLNGDGVTNALDAKLVLDYAAGILTEIDPVADVNADSVINTYDAHLLLADLATGAFDVLPGDSVNVTVSAKLTDEQMAALNDQYPNGAYVEGFVYAEPAQDNTGAACDSTHSIPVLGFYGSWSDPSMFGIPYADLLYGEDRSPYAGEAENNVLVISDEDGQWMQLGNPYLVEDAYPVGKAAVNAAALLDSYRFMLQRNAGALMLSITDSQGKALYTSDATNRFTAAYYYVNGGEWRNTMTTMTIGKTPAQLGLLENDVFTVTVTAVPEYYTLGQTLSVEDFQKLLASDVLGEGVSLETTMVVDNTAPAVVNVDYDEQANTLTVTASDNQYVAAMSLVSLDGTQIYATAAPAAEVADKSAQVFTLDLTGVKGEESCLILLGDYAGNESTYEVTLNLEGGSGGGAVGSATGSLFGFSTAEGNVWISIDPDECTISNTGMGDLFITAAEYVDGYAYMLASDECLYVAPHGNWNNAVKLSDLTGYVIQDMAFNYTDNKLYAVGAENKVYTVDLYTGQLTLTFQLDVVPTKADKPEAIQRIQGLAIDDNGTFYAVNHGGDGYEFATGLYIFDPANVVDGSITIEACKNSYGNSYKTMSGYSDNGQTLAWDHENDRLFYYSCGRYNIDSVGFLDVNPENKWSYGSLTSLSNSSLKPNLRAAYFVGKDVGVIEGATEAESLTVSASELKMMPGSTTTVTATVTPWTLKDQRLIWTSSDETVATVSGGKITALASGTAIITVTTGAAPHLSAQINLEVSDLPEMDLYAMLMDENGNELWVTFHTADPEAWQTVGYGDSSSSFGGVNLNDVVYVHDTGTIFAMNPDSFTREAVTGIGSSYAWPDAAAAPAVDGYFDRIVAPCFEGAGLAVINPYAATVVDFDLEAELAGDLLVTMAYAYDSLVTVESEETGEIYENCPDYTFYSITEKGAVYALTLAAYPNETGDPESENYDLTVEKLCTTALQLTNAAAVGQDDFASSIYDPESGCLVVMHYAKNDTTARVYAVEPNGGAMCALGNLGDAIWPAYSLYHYTPPTDLTLRVRTQSLDLYVGDNDKISASVAPVRFTGGLTYTSADTSVVTVDANGNVTAVGAGETYITITTVDVNGAGTQLSCQIPVSVEDVVKIDLTVNAKLDFDEDGSKWVTIHTNDLAHPTVVANDHAYLYHGTAMNGMIFGTDNKAYIDWNYWAVVTNLYYIEPGYDYDITPGGLVGYQNTPTDMTNMPAYTLHYSDAEGNDATLVAGDMPIYMDMRQQLIIWDYKNSDDLAAIFGWNLEGNFEGNPGAIAYMGMTTVTIDDGETKDAYAYAVLTDAGELYAINVIPYVTIDEDGNAVVDYDATIDALGNVGLAFDSPDPMHMVYVNDGVNQGFLVGYTDDCAQLYYVDVNVEALKVTFDSGKIGNIPGTNTFGAMYFDEDLNPTGQAPAFFGNQGQMLEANANVGPDRTAQVQSKLANDTLEVTGSLNAVEAVLEEKEADDGKLSIQITEEMAVTNGLVEVTYDPAVLTYAGSASHLLTTVNAQKGKLILAYASGKEVAASDVLATLHFTYDAAYINTQITVVATQRGNGNVTEEPEILTVICEVGGHDYQLTETVAPTCTEEGHEVYTCTKCAGHATVTLPAIGHDYVAEVIAPTYDDDGYTLHTCARCGDHFTDTVVPPLGHKCAAYTDIPSHWAKAGICYVIENGLMNGMTETEFGPYLVMNRAQMVTVLYRLAGCPETTENAPFTDVRTNSFYEKAVDWAWANGIVKGISDSTFDPQGDITREQMVTFFARYAAFTGIDTEPKGDLSAFDDGDGVSKFAKDAMAWAVEHDIIRGMDDGIIAPQDPANRAQVASVLMRYCNLFR